MTTTLSAPKAIFFDWDGTLADSFDLIMAAHNHARKNLGLEEFSPDTFRPYFGKPRDELYVALYGEMGEQARTYFEGFVNTNHSDYLNLVEGAAELLAECAAQGITMGVVSNKKGSLIRQEISHFGWDAYFSAVVCSGEASADKPDPAPILHALDLVEEPLTTADIWYVGDTITDVTAAYGAGSPCIFIGEWSDNHASEADISPAKAVANCTELKAFLLQYL